MYLFVSVSNYDFSRHACFINIVNNSLPLPLDSVRDLIPSLCFFFLKFFIFSLLRTYVDTFFPLIPQNVSSYIFVASSLLFFFLVLIYVFISLYLQLLNALSMVFSFGFFLITFKIKNSFVPVFRCTL